MKPFSRNEKSDLGGEGGRSVVIHIRIAKLPVSAHRAFLMPAMRDENDIGFRNKHQALLNGVGLTPMAKEQRHRRLAFTHAIEVIQHGELHRCPLDTANNAVVRLESSVCDKP